MTDQNALADKVQKIATAMRAAMRRDDDTYRDAQFLDDMSDYVKDLDKLCARARPRPTLADMTDDERRECKWMQADTESEGRVVITVCEWVDGRAAVLDQSGDVFYKAYADVTPRPDIPRMEWPGIEKPAPAPALPDGWRLADHPQYGPVVVTSMEPDDAGFVWFVRTDPYGGSEGYDAGCCKPDVLTFLAQGADTSATEGGGTSDTVPEGTLAVGSVWDDADALAQACRESESDHIVVADKQGTVGVWDKGIRCWRVTAPHAKFAPYTIIHAGKKADQ